MASSAAVVVDLLAASSTPRPVKPKRSSMPSGPNFQKHSSYYFQDVENTLFKTPRHVFEQDSAYFRNTFLLAEQNTQEGTAKNPLRLEGCSQDDFFQLLKIICPKHFQTREILTYDQWISVLKLATLWQFEEVRKLAIDTLTSIMVDPILRIEHARAYDVRQWYWIALHELGDGENSPSPQDAERLGVEFSRRVAELQGIFKGYKRCSREIPVVEFIASLFVDEVLGTEAPMTLSPPTKSLDSLVSSTAITVQANGSSGGMFGPTRLIVFMIVILLAWGMDNAS